MQKLFLLLPVLLFVGCKGSDDAGGGTDNVPPPSANTFKSPSDAAKDNPNIPPDVKAQIAASEAQGASIANQMKAKNANK